MKKLVVLVLFVSFTLLAQGCAVMSMNRNTGPLGPSVTIMPSQGKSLVDFKAEDEECRIWALKEMGGEEAVKAAQDRITKGVVVRTLVGTALGAVSGGLLGNAGLGTAIGGGTGLMYAAGTADIAEVRSEMELQQLYDTAYTQCMYSKGNQVMGFPNNRASP